MTWIVEFPNEWYLRGTNATGDKERATRYQTDHDARAALESARKYIKSAAYKPARIVEEPK